MKKNIKKITIVPKPDPRIKRGEISGCSNDSIFYIVEQLESKGFSKDDLKFTSLELDYGSCYYEGDTPSICVRWSDIL